MVNRSLSALFVLLALLAPSSARAGDCAALPNPVFIPATTDVKPFLTRIAPKLATADGGEALTLVYQGVGSCTAISYVTGTGKLTGNASYWSGALTDAGTPLEETCTFDVAGVRADLALSDVTLATCTGAPPDGGVGEFPSMVQPFGFVVPPSSTQQAITAEEAYFLFKFGGEAGKQVPPWTDPALIAIRTPAASTQLLIGLASGVPGTLWSANLTNINSGSSAVVSKIAAENATGNADKALGILSAQRYDENRSTLKMLAFQAFGQQCLGAVYPDSTAAALDKANVRDGHYAIWGYLWAVAAVDGAGQPQSPNAKRFISYLGGTAALNGANPIEQAARAGAVPACAMKVRRSFDGGPIQKYEPPEPCGCFYESIVAQTTCETCSGTCSGGKVCRFGYCEAR